jgi:hypothetical protein
MARPRSVSFRCQSSSAADNAPAPPAARTCCTTVAMWIKG